jgi:subtilase family serine protease
LFENRPLLGRSSALLLALLVAAAAVAVLAGSGSTPRAAVARGLTPDTLRAPNIRRQITRAAHPSATVVFTCQLPGADPVCYGPDQMRTAYGTQLLADKGYNGAGRTIVIVDAYGNPTLTSDVALFNSTWGLPATDLTTYTPFGVDPTTPANAEGWSGETTLDVEWAHSIALGAKIALVIAKSNNDADILDATQYAIDHNLGDTVSQSFGEAEQCMSAADLARQHKLFRQAVSKGMTLFASSGDQGAGQPNCNGPGYFKAASTPASDPNVTGVGGTELHADGPTGTYQSETTWNESATFGDAVAGGGGQSVLFGRPFYQALATHDRTRDVPDVSYNAAVFHGVIVAWEGDFWLFGGTSAGSPQWAGIQAIVDQIAGHRMGNINPALYALALLPGSAKPFHDIADGSNNSVPNGLGGTITGFTAVKGYDMATGLGSPNINALAPLIAKLPATTTPTD